MFSSRRLIAGYVLQSALPYVLLALALLTAILFTQQTGRFAELALYNDLPLSLAAQIAAALLPNVLILTLPVAVLAGIIIGFSRMGSDSEIIAIRAAGVGTWSLLWPALLIGLLATGATTFLHFKEAPRAARDLRQAALQGALRKLDSPVEPRTFNTEIPGYIDYVTGNLSIEGTRFHGRVQLSQGALQGSLAKVTRRPRSFFKMEKSRRARCQETDKQSRPEKAPGANAGGANRDDLAITPHSGKADDDTRQNSNR